MNDSTGRTGGRGESDFDELTDYWCRTNTIQVIGGWS